MVFCGPAAVKMAGEQEKSLSREKASYGTRLKNVLFDGGLQRHLIVDFVRLKVDFSIAQD